MEPAAIMATAAAALTVLKPYIPTIAAKAAAKIGSELPAAVGKLWTALQGKFDMPFQIGDRTLTWGLAAFHARHVQRLGQVLEDIRGFCHRASLSVGFCRVGDG